VDPLVSVTGEPFSFAGDDPVNGSDPSGLCHADPLTGSFWTQGNCLSGALGGPSGGGSNNPVWKAVDVLPCLAGGELVCASVESIANSNDPDPTSIGGEPDWVVRGGSCTLESFNNQETNSQGLLTDLSVQYSPGLSVAALSQPISRYGQVGVTTAQQIEALGGKVTPEGRKYHAIVSGITPQQAYDLFNPTMENPGK
jgi:hypothetical protein